jgi:hypothetical protein
MLLCRMAVLAAKGCVMKRGAWVVLVLAMVAILGWRTVGLRLAAIAPAEIPIDGESVPLLEAAVEPAFEVSKAANTAERPRQVAQAPANPPVAPPTARLAEPDFRSPPDSFAAPFASAFISQATPVVEVPADALSVDPGPLRRELIAAIVRKLQLMSVDQLRDSLQREYTAIRELEAEIQLAKAKQALEALSQSHPETKAGKTAGHILRTNPMPSDFTSASATGASFLVPAPSDEFETVPRRTR